MLLRIGDRVKPTAEHARRYLPVDRVNREKYMALRGRIEKFTGLDLVHVAFEGWDTIKMPISDLELAD